LTVSEIVLYDGYPLSPKYRGEGEGKKDISMLCIELLRRRDT